MKKITIIPLIIALLLASCNKSGTNNINYGSFPVQKVAQKPPMGWNSWDVFGTSVTEEEVKKAADYMSEHLKEFGYEYIVIDLGWYGPELTAVNHQYKNPFPEQIIDEYGRLLPTTNRFPSAAHNGFKSLADYVHQKGLKFGIHIMRGIPRQAVEQNTPVKGTGYKARDIVMYEKACTFYDGMLSIDMTKPGSQEYYNSIIELYSSWGVDFIKADDMTSYPPKFDEAKAVRYAIEHSGRDIVLSLSPGAVSAWDRSFLQHYADMYRISGDFWDEWPKLKEMFNKCRTFKGHTGPGGWADCDMIPLGVINIRGEHGNGARNSKFTPDEQQTLMTLWSVFRSPLMLGMDLTQLDSATLSVLTNREVLKINQNSVNNTELEYTPEKVVWIAGSPDGKEKYIAFFNLSDTQMKFNVMLEAFGIKGFQSVADIWAGSPVDVKEGSITLDINPHGCKYLKIKI